MIRTVPRRARVAGYSATPLARKLGLKEHQKVAFLRAPDDLPALLGPLPDGLRVLRRAGAHMDLLLLFATSRAGLGRSLPPLPARLSPAGAIWVAWPKKASGSPTDLSFDVVQRAGLACALVDVKVCAIDGTWSGLKFVIPRARRGMAR